MYVDGGARSDTKYLVMYGQPASSTGRNSSGSSATLTVGALVAVIVVVVMVVGVLLACPVLYWLHRSRGVAFPRLARLSGGRLFNKPASAENDINLPMLANDHQQVPMQPSHHQPYQPALHQSLSASQSPPPAPPSSFLLPHSFVSSPQYYQPVS